ncbi:MAG: CRISPR-associated endonuclease Cas1 [Bacteroidota bacterium]
MQLVINTKGTGISWRQGAFEIQNKDGKHRLSPDKISSIMITNGVKVSSDAILQAVNHDIDILIVNGQGAPAARIWHHRFGSISVIRKAQLDFATGLEGAKWVKHCLSTRLANMSLLLKSLHRDRPAKQDLIEKTLQTIQGFENRIRELPDTPLEDSLKARMRGWEGNASRAYFGAVARIIPEMYFFSKRSRRPAKDLFNCVLNYLYGILYGRLEIAMIRAGIDPYIGVFHRDEYNRPVMVYDMIECYRLWPEAVLLQLCFRKALDNKMVSERKGGLWLDISGKKLAISSMNDYLETVIQYKGKRRSRLHHLQQDCHDLAAQIKTLHKHESTSPPS